MEHLWRPLDSDRTSFVGQSEGIPAWLRPSLESWMRQIFEKDRTWDWVTPVIEQYDLLSQSEAPLSRHFDRSEPRRMLDLLEARGETFKFIDFMVHQNETALRRRNRDLNEYLEVALNAGGSAWTVGVRHGVAGLERRVALGAQEAASAVVLESGQAGELLSVAWHAAFGHSPDPEKAYVNAIKAVEAAVVPMVSPNDKTATLSKVVGQMRKQSDWALPFDGEHEKNPTPAVVLSMCQALMSGHSDRHAGSPGYVPTTLPAAQAAVMLAVPLVQWFHSGAIRRPQKTAKSSTPPTALR